MASALAWLVAHWGEIAAAAAAFLAFASIVTRYTKTTADDKVVAFLQQALGLASALQPKASGGGVKLPGTAAERPLLEERPDNVRRMDQR